MELKLVAMRVFFGFLVCVLYLIPAGALNISPFATIREVGVNLSVTLDPASLDVLLEDSPGMNPGALVAATRLRIQGLSRLQHVEKFHHTFRVKIETVTSRFGWGGGQIDVCFHRNGIMGLAQCEKESWRTIEKSGHSSFSMSPFETKFMDVRISGPLTDLKITVSVHDERSAYRLVCLAMGVTLLVLAPIVSGWVPFYYTTAMTLGILMVVLVIAYQTMKLLPAGRKSSLYIFLYGSMIGLGSVIIHYFGGLVSSVLSELGFSEDMYNPVAVFMGVAVGLLGAWLGYWGVRKLVIAEDGNIDDGTARFVKWAIRVVGSVSLLQTSNDPVFMILALMGGSALAYVILNVRVSLLDLWEYLRDIWTTEPLIGKGVSFQSPRKHKKSYMTPAQMDALRRLPGTDTLVQNAQLCDPPISEGSTPGPRRKRYTKTDETFVSTFHNSPAFKPISKHEYEETTKEYTYKAVKELERSKEFADWKNANTHRFYVSPYEHRAERLDEEIERTANLEEINSGRGFFRRR